MSKVLDKQSLLERVGDDLTLLEQLFALYERRSVEVITELRQRAVACDAAVIAQSAHQLRGMLANMSGLQATALAAALEDSAKRRQLPEPAQVQAQVETLADAVSSLTAELKSFLAQRP